MKNFLCKVRQDLVKQELSPPVGYNMYAPPDNTTYEYRWLELGEEEIFQIFFNGAWVDATSIDFEFIDQNGQSGTETQP